MAIPSLTNQVNKRVGLTNKNSYQWSVSSLNLIVDGPCLYVDSIKYDHIQLAE